MPQVHLPAQPAPSRPSPLQAWQRAAGALLPALGLALAMWADPAGAWEPTQPVELVVPAGTGGGADQMARFIAQAVGKHGLMKQPLQVVNRAGQSGGEGLLEVKAARGNPHKLVITLSNLFTAPMGQGLAFSWRDLTPVQMLALDQFVLWVPAASPHKTPQELFEALRTSAPGTFKLGGTGSKQEDQLLSVLLETATSTRITYIPLRGGGDVAKALAAKQVDMTVNNPIEAEALWREGKVRPLCVFDGAPIEHRQRVAGNQGWSDLPTCMSAGIPVQYLMMRGLFMPPDVPPAALDYYLSLIRRVRATPEWAEFMQRGAFKPSELAGAVFETWLERAASFHKVIMREARLLPGGAPAAAAASGAVLQAHVQRRP